MRRLLIGLIPWMGMAMALAQDTRPAHVVYTNNPSTPGAVRLGDECYVPVSVASSWGWVVRFNDETASIEAEGRLIRVRSATILGKPMVPVIATCYQLGADATWTGRGDTLTVKGVIRNLEVGTDGIRVHSTLALSPETSTSKSPERLVVDFPGARLWPGSSPSLPNGIRIKPNGDDTVRLVVERPGASLLKIEPSDRGRSFRITFPSKIATPSYEPLPRVEPQLLPSNPPFTDEAAAPVAPSIKVAGSLRIEGRTDTEATLVVPLSAALSARPSGGYSEPTTIEVLLPNVEPPNFSTLGLDSELIRGVQLLDDGRGSTRLIVETSRPLGFLLSQVKSEVRLRLIRPKASDGKLAGKTIVIDAGHGGPDSGTQWKNPAVNEKDLTLKIARIAAKLLSSEGAAVIMTRNDDTKIPLKERPAIASRSKADLFVSIHINSNKLSDSRSGSITFYHKQSAMGILLAECIQSEIVKVSGLPGMGIWSDTRIYSSGFAVLRYATMPAVLIECGFLNHKVDRQRMMTAEFQNSVAAAIVKGLKVFTGNVESEESSK